MAKQWQCKLTSMLSASSSSSARAAAIPVLASTSSTMKATKRSGLSPVKAKNSVLERWVRKNMKQTTSTNGHILNRHISPGNGCCH